MSPGCLDGSQEVWRELGGWFDMVGVVFPWRRDKWEEEVGGRRALMEAGKWALFKGREEGEDGVELPGRRPGLGGGPWA